MPAGNGDGLGRLAGLPPGGGAPGTPVPREDPVVTVAADRPEIPCGHDRVPWRDLKRYPVLAALPRQALLAPCCVPGHIAGDEHGLG
jgi:hypothetical protein